MAKKVDQKEFEKILKAKEIVFVDFFATWCGPCQMMEPIIEELSEDFEKNEKVEIVQVDIDQNPELSAKYSVMSIPTLILFKDEKPVDTMIGARSKDVIAESIKKALL